MTRDFVVERMNTHAGQTLAGVFGGKGANLAEMSVIGLPVPAGLTITTEVCNHYYAHGRTWPADLQSQIDANIAKIEAVMGKKFGDLENPLLLSVRSQASAIWLSLLS